jgi:FHA domain-containing protein
MPKTPRKLMGRPAFDDRGNATWEWAREDDTTKIATGRFRALAEGLALETPPPPETPDPYNQAPVEGEEKPRRRSLNDMRLLSENIKRKREHQQLVKRLRNEPRTDASEPARGARLLLQFEDRELWMDKQQSSITIGRGSDNGLVVKGLRTSRLHAHIQIRGDKFVLVDLSANGTYVQTADGKVLLVSRNSLQFEGRGMIGLGDPPVMGSVHTICFTCERPESSSQVQD